MRNRKLERISTDARMKSEQVKPALEQHIAAPSLPIVTARLSGSQGEAAVPLRPAVPEPGLARNKRVGILRLRKGCGSMARLSQSRLQYSSSRHRNHTDVVFLTELLRGGGHFRRRLPFPHQFVNPLEAEQLAISVRGFCNPI